MELRALHKRVIGLDVHQAQITACALIEEADASVRIEQRQFGGLGRERQALAQWAASLLPDEVVMESTGIYCKRSVRGARSRGDSGQGGQRAPRMCQGAKPTWAMPSGWRRWPARGCCAAHLCHRQSCVNCV